MTSDEIELFRLPINRGDGAKLMPFFYNGFKYRTKGRADDVYKKGRGAFSCTDPLCRATFTVRRKQVGDEDVFFTYSLPMHNHDSRVYERKHESDVINSIKLHTSERAGKGERLDPSDVAADCAAIIDGCGDMRGSLTKRIVMKVLNNQKPITKKEDIVFPQDMMQYVLFSSPDNGLIIFGDTQLVILACSVNVILIDGTFSRCPVTHYQLVTLHAMTSSQRVTFPFMYIIMSGKSADDYSAALNTAQRITANIADGKSLFDRSELTVKTDFEKGFLTAMKQFKCKSSGCYFHYCQPVHRKVMKMGIHHSQHDVENRRIINALMMIPLFTKQHMMDVFNHIFTTSTSHECSPLLNYAKRQWFSNDNMIDIICQYKLDDVRTNNVCEAFHSTLVKRIPVVHPSFNMFFDSLMKIIRLTRTHVMNKKKVNKDIVWRQDREMSGRIAMATQITYFVTHHELPPHSIGDVLDECQNNFERFKNSFIRDEDVDDTEPIQHITSLPCVGDDEPELVWNGEVVSGMNVGKRGTDVEDVIDVDEDDEDDDFQIIVEDDEEDTDVTSVKKPRMNKADKEEDENRKSSMCRNEM